MLSWKVATFDFDFVAVHGIVKKTTYFLAGSDCEFDWRFDFLLRGQNNF